MHRVYIPFAPLALPVDIMYVLSIVYLSADSVNHINANIIEQDALPTFPNEEAFACIEKELGLQLDSIFSSISPSPIAAASLGQVYKARLRYSGQLVAVKVQRPGIEEAIGLDFYLIRGLGFFINKYVDIITSDVVALIDEFARRVYQELNYVQVSIYYCINGRY